MSTVERVVFRDAAGEVVFRKKCTSWRDLAPTEPAKHDGLWFDYIGFSDGTAVFKERPGQRGDER